MKKVHRLLIKIMKKLGFVAVEHIVYAARYVPSRDNLFLTLKHIVVTEIEFFRENTPKETIEYHTKAFARQKIGINDLYSYRTRWSWRFIE